LVIVNVLVVIDILLVVVEVLLVVVEVLLVVIDVLLVIIDVLLVVVVDLLVILVPVLVYVITADSLVAAALNDGGEKSGEKSGDTTDMLLLEAMKKVCIFKLFFFKFGSSKDRQFSIFSFECGFLIKIFLKIK